MAWERKRKIMKKTMLREDICWMGVPGCRHLIVVTLKKQKLEGEGKRINDCTFATVNKRA